ncbi:MAG: hydantoinase/oxoprolinase family protein [Pelosinus sp.]|nr:hydantoinase/oxoprolinase family protein [Pelosinus sp.]
MWLGIDVGGTFTDAVIIDKGEIIHQVKTPTTHDDLLQGILEALDQVLREKTNAEFERISLSTTIVTNALIQGKLDQVALLAVSGPGIDITDKTPVKPHLLAGYIDHRGRETAKVAVEELEGICCQSTKNSIFAVSGKFAVRNPEQEIEIAHYLQEHVNPKHITLGSKIAGTLNFLRRTNTAYYNAAVWQTFEDFAAAIEDALVQRHITAPVYMLKADGGTLPLETAKELPVEAVFTGPAASVLGIMAMSKISVPAVSLDIGGTTTDIALWKDGGPLFAGRGASIDGYPTSVRAFRLKSVGIGGDSLVQRVNGQIKVGPMRLGPAMAFGGNAPTVTDALLALGLISHGDKNLALQAMEKVALPGVTLAETARQAAEAAAEEICRAIQAMLDDQAAEPVYRVEDIIHEARLQPELVVGVGGGAMGLVSLVAKRLKLGYEVPPNAMVANAVGAAVAKPTMAITVRVDTEQGRYTVAELSISKPLPQRKFNLQDTRELAANYLTARAKRAGITADKIEELYTEEFNIVRGFQTVGKIITCSLQIKPDVLAYLGNEGRNHHD